VASKPAQAVQNTDAAKVVTAAIMMSASSSAAAALAGADATNAVANTNGANSVEQSKSTNELKQPLQTAASRATEANTAQPDMKSQKQEANVLLSALPMMAAVDISSSLQQAPNNVADADASPATTLQSTRQQAAVLAARDANAEVPAETKFYFKSWGNGEGTDHSVTIRGGSLIIPSDETVKTRLEQYDKTNPLLGKALPWQIGSVESALDSPRQQRRQAQQEETTDE
jgi:hypothetical protein